MKLPRRKLRLFFAPALALLCCGAGAPGCDRQRAAGGGNNNTPAAALTPTPANTPARGGEGQKPVTTDAELRLIDASSQTKVSDSFVAVARDRETYAALRKLHESLPELDAEFFKTNAVVAAFLGRRRSGGYAVEIARAEDGALRVSERARAKDAMTTMALTAPCRVVSFAHWPEQPVRLLLGETWQRQTRPYRVTAGEFTMTGGFAGVPRQFKVSGTLGVLSHKNLATVVFDLKGDGEQARSLADAATGTVSDSSGELSVARLDPGTFVLPPRHAMRAMGRFSEGGAKLALDFEASQTAVADGFGGRGTLEAEATGPAPPKRAGGDDEPM